MEKDKTSKNILKYLKKFEPNWRPVVKTTNLVKEMGGDDKLISAILIAPLLAKHRLTEEKIEKKFGREIAFLAKTVAKVKSIDSQDFPKEKTEQRHQAGVKNARKFLLLMSRDIRVILFKIAQQIVNLENSDLPKWRLDQIAQSALLILAPIAERLSLGRAHRRLNKLAFRQLYPDKYRKLNRKLKEIIASFPKKPDQLIKKMESELKRDGLNSQLKYRAKDVFSVSQKLEKNHSRITDLNDLIGIRIITKSQADCYRILGLVNRLWPVKKIKDYISQPKAHGYQSIHVIIELEENHSFEVQIRTKEMERKAEQGPWAHWQYKEGKIENKEKFQEELGWAKELAGRIRKVQAQSFEELKINLFKDRVFLYTPKKEIIELPKGSTPIDFAYQIHSDLGNNLKGAKVNGKLVKLNYKLKNGQVVEIMTDKHGNGQAPTADWLKSAQSEKAKEHIRKAIKKIE